MDVVSERRRYRWRQGILDDSTGAADKALRHGRFDLFYGPFYLRFTRGPVDDGHIRLRLEERARLVARRDGGTDLRPSREAPSGFAYEEVLVADASVSRAPRLPPVSGRLFFERAAHLLDDLAAEAAPRP